MQNDMVNQSTYYQTLIETKLGTMLAISNTTTLYILEFVDRLRLTQQIKRIQQYIKSSFISEKVAPIYSIESELADYFAGDLKDFKTPTFGIGSVFQQSVWDALKTIPYGETRSYAEIARMINKPTAVRAVANAIGANPLAIIIPCHRVISTSGTLGGYAGGLMRKAWLLERESNTQKSGYKS